MGFTSDITNKVNGKKYLISSAEDKRAGGWQISVFERKLFGIPNLFHPAMFLGALDGKHARLVHAHVEEIVAILPPAEWQSAKWGLVDNVLDAMDVSHPESNATLRPQGNHGEPGNAELGMQAPPEESDGHTWATFHGKPNTDIVLCEKAKAVTSLIELLWDAGLVLAAPFTDSLDGPQVRLGEEEARRVLAETAVFLIRIVDESPFGALNPEERDTFMDELDICVGRALENKGVELRFFADLLSQRLPEYAQYRKWIPEGNESPKDTLFWEFGKKIGAVIGLQEHAGFNVELGLLLLKGVNTWELPELLRE
jgi:hypothetical protein